MRRRSDGELLTEPVCTMEIDCWTEGVDVEDEVMVVVTERRRIVGGGFEGFGGGFRR